MPTLADLPEWTVDQYMAEVTKARPMLTGDQAFAAMLNGMVINKQVVACTNGGEFWITVGRDPELDPAVYRGVARLVPNKEPTDARPG